MYDQESRQGYSTSPISFVPSTWSRMSNTPSSSITGSSSFAMGWTASSEGRPPLSSYMSFDPFPGAVVGTVCIRTRVAVGDSGSGLISAIGVPLRSFLTLVPDGKDEGPGTVSYSTLIDDDPSKASKASSESSFISPSGSVNVKTTSLRPSDLTLAILDGQSFALAKRQTSHRGPTGRQITYSSQYIVLYRYQSQSATGTEMPATVRLEKVAHLTESYHHWIDGFV